MNSWMVKDNPKLASALARIEALGSRFDNMDSPTADFAAWNLVEDKPAYWDDVRGYGDAKSGIFLWEINAKRGVQEGADSLRQYYPAGDYGSERYLDHLLPLNDAAVRDLVKAYQAIGSFRTYSELIRRADRAEEPEIKAAAE